MSIKQLKKEYGEKFGMEEPDEIWQFIEKQVIPEVTKSMLVEEREIDKSNPEAEIGIKKAIFYANDKGFNQSCALQKELAEKLVPIDNNKSTKSRVSI